jgi:hypothetical protein
MIVLMQEARSCVEDYSAKNIAYDVLQYILKNGVDAFPGRTGRGWCERSR